MDLSNKILSKVSLSWMDVQKQLLNVMQTRTTTGISVSSLQNATSGGTGTATSSSTIAINKIFVKQCTDFLIKHIKNLNQKQIIDHLENLAQSSGLMVFKTPSEEDPATINAFLNTDDFYFEVSINSKGEITDVKFSICSEPAKSSNLLKEIFCSWNWDLLSKHIEGIKSNFILTDPDHQIRTKGFKSIQYLENDLNTLYQIQVKYLERILKLQTTTNDSNHQMKHLDKLINQTPIGVLKKSELGQPMRLHYYLSPLDLIQQQNSSKHLSIDQLINSEELGAYVSISLESTRPNRLETKNKLPDTPLLVLNENDDFDNSWHDHLNPYLNPANFNFEKSPLFKSVNAQKNHPQQQQHQIPGTYIVKLNKPVVMCSSTLNHLQTQIGIETFAEQQQPRHQPFFEQLAKTSIINQKFLNDAYSVQLPDESQVYYITELDEAACMGVVVHELLFIHPQDLIAILETLRKQLLFNELLLSCMRKLCSSALSVNSNNSYNNNSNNNKQQQQRQNIRILEIGLVEPFVVSIIMQHPKLLCYTTIEIDVSKGSVETRFRDHNDLHNPNVISEIIRRCHSIPVTIRALLMKYRQTSNNSSKRKVNLNNNNNNSGNSDSNQNPTNHTQTNTNDVFHNTNINNSNNNSNNTQSNGNHNNKNNHHHKKTESESSQEEELYIGPLSLTTGLNETPRRLTPSRRDSYNRNSSSSSSSNLRTPNGQSSSSSIFNFSTLVNNQMKLQEKKLNEEAAAILLAQSLEKIKSQQERSALVSDLKLKLKAQMNSNEDVNSDAVKTEKTTTNNNNNKHFKSQQQQQQPLDISTAPTEPATTTTTTTIITTTTPSSFLSTTTAVTKKRKASSSSCSNTESLPTTPSQSSSSSSSLQPSAAKRKMTNQNNNDTAAKTPNSNSSSKKPTTTDSTGQLVKKNKIKSSQSTNSLTAAVATTTTNSTATTTTNINKSSENLNRKLATTIKPTIALPTKSSDKSSIKKSSEGVLTTLNNTNTSSLNKNSKSSSNNLSKSNLTNNNNNNNNKKPNVSPQVTTSKSNQQMRAKPITEDGLKIRISKSDLANSSKLSSQRSTSTSSINYSPNLYNNNNNNKSNNLLHHNMSATEIQLQKQQTPPMTLSSNLSNSNTINNTPASAIQQIQLHNANLTTRTPSPSSFALLSMQSTPNLVEVESASSETSSSVNETSSRSEVTSKSTKSANKLTKPSLNLSNLLSMNCAKTNVPVSQSPSLASSLGLGTTFKASTFKIPKAKNTDTSSDNNAEDIKTPLSSSSPIPNLVTTTTTTRPSTSIGSPNRNTDSTTSTNNNNNKNLKNNNNPSLCRSNSATTTSSSASSSSSSSSNARSNASPKWQPSYSGNMSPRYINNYESTSPSAISPSQQQQITKNMPKSLNNNSNSRPLTPIPTNGISSSSSNSNRYHSSNKQPPLIHHVSAKLLPLMSSFNSNNNTNSKFDLMTPSSPNSEVSQINESAEMTSSSTTTTTTTLNTKSNANVCSPTPSSSLPQPPDSPVCETAPMVIPKLIPLERSNNTIATAPPLSIEPKQIPLNNNNNSQLNNRNLIFQNPTESKLKSRAVDIASPDPFLDNEDDNDNLVIDITAAVSTTTAIISTHRTPSTKIISTFSHLKSSAFTSSSSSSSNSSQQSTTTTPATVIIPSNADIVNESPALIS